MPADPRAMSASAAGDLEQLAALREGFALAETTGTLAFFEEVLADDAVILAPWRPACEGKAACLEFIREVLDDVGHDFEREMSLSSAELRVLGDWAFDRGTFWQRLVRKDDRVELEERGKYLWLYRREADSWKLARLVGNHDWQDEDEALGTDGTEPVDPGRSDVRASPGA